MAKNRKQILEHENVTVSPMHGIYFEHYYDNGRLVSNHWHDDVEIIYMINGDLDVSIGFTTCHYTKGDLILVNSQVIHSTFCASPNESVLIQIPYLFLKRYIPDMDDYLFILDKDNESPIIQTKLLQIKEIIEQMLFITETHPDGENLRFSALFFDLLYTLYHNFKTNDFQSISQKRATNLNKLKPILEYTQSHYSEAVSIKDISAIAGYQSDYFCRMFKKNMGQTYIEYLNEIRLSHIYQDLLSTKYPIQDILELHGFTNYKLFRRMFDDKFHTTPSKLRKSALTLSTLSSEL